VHLRLAHSAEASYHRALFTSPDADPVDYQLRLSGHARAARSHYSAAGNHDGAHAWETYERNHFNQAATHADNFGRSYEMHRHTPMDEQALATQKAQDASDAYRKVAKHAEMTQDEGIAKHHSKKADEYAEAATQHAETASSDAKYHGMLFNRIASSSHAIRSAQAHGHAANAWRIVGNARKSGHHQRKAQEHKHAFDSLNESERVRPRTPSEQEAQAARLRTAEYTATKEAARRGT